MKTLTEKQRHCEQLKLPLNKSIAHESTVGIFQAMQDKTPFTWIQTRQLCMASIR